MGFAADTACIGIDGKKVNEVRNAPWQLFSSLFAFTNERR
jgi:hypothetical protein